MTQQSEAEALVGKYVRFAHLPANCEPTPIRVLRAENGMVVLAGWAGYFAPHLFVVVGVGEVRKAQCRSRVGTPTSSARSGAA